jgi:hypothetical protein
MKLFSEIEKTIERGFRKWTSRMFGEAQADELLLVHRAILEQVEGKVQVLGRGKCIFPFSRVCVTLHSPDPERRAVYQAAFGEEHRLESEIREVLEHTGCEIPRAFAVEVATSEAEGQPFEIEYGSAPSSTDDRPLSSVNAAPEAQKPAPTAEPARLIVVKGKTAREQYVLEKARTNIGRTAELTDADQHVIGRNDVVFEEGADESNATVSRRHAHIVRDGGEYRLIDDGSEFGTRVFRDGRPVEVPAGSRRGEKLRSGDEIYLGRACLRFEQ